MKLIKRRRMFGVVVASALALVASKQASAGCAFDPFIGTVCLVGFNFCPAGYAEANGALLAISQNTALFSLLGTTYGGDGESTFALPDLRGRVPVGQGSGPGLTPRNQGSKFGADTHMLTTDELPSHSHGATTDISNLAVDIKGNSVPGNTAEPGANMLADTRRNASYISGSLAENDVVLASRSATISGAATTSIANAGNGSPHNNTQPSLGMRYCIALVGVYPSES